MGRLELDLIARRPGLVVFCEVRTRRSAAFAHPATTIDRRKAARVRAAAARWLAEHPVGPTRIRIDAAAVVLEGPSGGPEVTYYEGAL